MTEWRWLSLRRDRQDCLGRTAGLPPAGTTEWSRFYAVRNPRHLPIRDRRGCSGSAQFHRSPQNADRFGSIGRLTPNSLPRDTHRAKAEASDAKIVADEQFSRFRGKLFCGFVVHVLLSLSGSGSVASTSLVIVSIADPGAVALAKLWRALSTAGSVRPPSRRTLQFSRRRLFSIPTTFRGCRASFTTRTSYCS